MKKIKINLDRDEVLRYSGVKCDFSELSEDIQKKYLQIIRFTEENAKYSFVVRKVRLIRKSNEPIKVAGTSLAFCGNSVKEHLNGCENCLLLVLSLGAWGDRQGVLYCTKDQVSSLIFDACCTQLIEFLADCICNELSKNYGNLTARFGPGYGDLPLDIQKIFLAVTGADKKLGITVVNNLMIPLKTITAIIGIKNHLITDGLKKSCISKCDICTNKCDCAR